MANTNGSIAVIGAGLMGHGIALVMAKAGHEVCLSDPHQASRDTAIQRIKSSLQDMGTSSRDTADAVARVTICETVKEAVRDSSFVFEAAPEKLPLKQKLFAEIEQFAPPDCVLASNTSVIQISLIMKELNSRHRALGTHWWNPPHMIPLVEVIRTEWTDDGVVDQMMSLLADAEKTPVRVEKDVPGFIGNRLQHALWREAISLVENGICDAESVDTVVKASFGRRLAVLGPLENADLVGTDLTLDIHENVLFDLESRKGPSPYLQKIVEDGRLGMKSGSGLRDWTEAEASAVGARVPAFLKKLGSILNT